MTVTRRQFLHTTGIGVALGALGGCASTMQGDFAPKTGKRVVVIGGGWGGATLAYNVRSPREVDEAIDEARRAGARIAREPAETFWGGYSAVFVDPDGDRRAIELFIPERVWHGIAAEPDADFVGRCQGLARGVPWDRYRVHRRARPAGFAGRADLHGQGRGGAVYRAGNDRWLRWQGGSRAHGSTRNGGSLRRHSCFLPGW